MAREKAKQEAAKLPANKKPKKRKKQPPQLNEQEYKTVKIRTKFTDQMKKEAVGYLSKGLQMRAVAQLVGISRETIAQQLKHDPEFAAEYKRAYFNNYLEEFEQAKSGEMSNSVFIFRCKSVYKNLIEQEDRMPSTAIQVNNTQIPSPSFDFDNAIKRIKSATNNDHKLLDE